MSSDETNVTELKPGAEFTLVGFLCRVTSVKWPEQYDIYVENVLIGYMRVSNYVFSLYWFMNTDNTMVNSLLSLAGDDAEWASVPTRRELPNTVSADGSYLVASYDTQLQDQLTDSERRVWLRDALTRLREYVPVATRSVTDADDPVCRSCVAWDTEDSGPVHGEFIQYDALDMRYFVRYRESSSDPSRDYYWAYDWFRFCQIDKHQDSVLSLLSQALNTVQ